MCWSLEVSIAFAALEFIGCVFLFVRNQRLDRAILPICILVFLIEFLEIFMWLANPTTLDLSCTSLNSWALRAARVVLIFQPMAQNYFCLRTCNEKTRPKFEVLFALATAAAIIGTALIIHTESYVEKPFESDVMTEYHRDTNPAGKITCAYLGSNGHLLWKFKSHSASAGNWFPNSFAYMFIGMIFPIIYHRPWMDAGFISLLMFVEFVLAFLYFKTAEAYSVWCWLGLTVHLWAVSYPFVYPKLLSKKIE